VCRSAICALSCSINCSCSLFIGGEYIDWKK
jgi:hypothetical protein